jgi:hypothetical protein
VKGCSSCSVIVFKASAIEASIKVEITPPCTVLLG